MNQSHLVLGGGAAALALFAAFAGSPRPRRSGTIDVAALAHDIEHEDDHVTAVELAQWIKDRKPGLRVFDVRSDAEFSDFHIPTAEHVPLGRLSAMHPAGSETLVLYSEGGAHAAQGWVLLRSLGFTHVYFLRGGLLDWMDDVMNPALPDRKGNATSDATRARVAMLSRYFGGVPRATPALPAATSTSAAQVVARVKRRGC
ncbi:MAG: rhodanese-like domain-containing protein [bacterium]